MEKQKLTTTFWIISFLIVFGFMFFWATLWYEDIKQQERQEFLKDLRQCSKYATPEKLTLSAETFNYSLSLENWIFWREYIYRCVQMKK